MRRIDADALKKTIADAFYNLREIAYIADIIERQPTIEAEPVRHGRWIKQENGMNVCSACGVKRVSRFNFCGNCGAKMDAKED
jgi:hypothetical protein